MKTVLIIDPSLIVRKILETCLRRVGIESEAYPDGIEALQALHNDPDPAPAIVILEVTLPHMDGYRVVQYLRGQGYRSTAIVMLSRRDGVLDRLKGRLADANGYLTKPFTVKQILEVVQRSQEMRGVGAELATPLRNEIPALTQGHRIQ